MQLCDLVFIGEIDGESLSKVVKIMLDIVQLNKNNYWVSALTPWAILAF